MHLDRDVRFHRVSFMFFVVLLTLENFFLGSFGLRLLSLEIPPAVSRGDSIWLNCTLDIEIEDLYSIKWYKNDVEFYRFLPRDNPSGQTYNVPGIFVNLDKSSQGSVFMKTTDMDSEGLYRCEASAESPTFQTAEGQKYMSVYVLPQEGPIIRGNQLKHGIGDLVNVSCSSEPSKPPADITWYINEREAPSEYQTELMMFTGENGLSRSSKGLKFTVGPQHMGGGSTINLRCTASVSQSYSMSSEEVIFSDKVPEKSSSGTSLPLINQFYSNEGPVITGINRRYGVGDVLNINCSSKLKSAPDLQWFLNDEQVNERNVIRYPKVRYSDGSESSTLGLNFKVMPGHFDYNDEMKLKCTATLSQIIHTRSDERNIGGNHKSSGLHVAENIGRVSDRSNAPGNSNGPVQLLVTLIATSFIIILRCHQH